MLCNGAQVFHISVICHTLLWLVSHTGKTVKVEKFSYGPENMNAEQAVSSWKWILKDRRKMLFGGNKWAEWINYIRTGGDEWL